MTIDADRIALFESAIAPSPKGRGLRVDEILEEMTAAKDVLLPRVQEALRDPNIAPRNLATAIKRAGYTCSRGAIENWRTANEIKDYGAR